MAAHEEGLPVFYTAYMSTSTNADGYSIQGGQVVRIIIHHSTSGRDINGVGNDFENEVIYQRDSAFFVKNVIYDSNGIPTIYLQEDIENGTRDDGQLYSEERGMALRTVPEANSIHDDLSNIQKKDSNRDSGRSKALQRKSSKVNNSISQEDSQENIPWARNLTGNIGRSGRNTGRSLHGSVD
ncbi:hypothetical protein [Acidaminobacterium chupaoyuni]|mgnify:CR=1 FL=1